MKKEFYRKLLILFLLFLFWIFLIFFIKNYFFGYSNINYIEENYIDYSLPKQKSLDESGKLDSSVNLSQNNKELSKKLKENFSSASKIYFLYIPEYFNKEVENYSSLLGDFFNTDFIYNKLDKINVELYEELFDVRGKMKNTTIKLYGVLKMEKEEFLSVNIHEFAHYVDLYFLKKKVLKDLSDSFYSISWKETKILKPGQKQEDFVSGYSMSNKYEDFAESFTYYILHNDDFLEKTKQSTILKTKYDFFSKIIFRNNEFKNIDLSNNNKIKDYYRDITKIDFNLKKLLQYLKTGL